VSEQRGFTLVEVLVAVGIVAMLCIGVAIALTSRPGALRAATESFEASFAAARAIAATSGNGATLVVLPRSPHGFTLRVYAGRPNADGAVTLANAPALISDADVREATLGAPPFSIFISSAGNASGLAGYPTLDGGGAPRFVVVASQPPCPAGGIALTFSTPSGRASRVLPCGATAFGSPLPLATATPAAVVLTPKALVYHWPSAPSQTFVATEWGYTRWFAAGAFACGDSVATFPAAPPYSPPHAPEDAATLPLAPAGVPVSFANAPDSMEDAPATFPLVPATAGVCTATIADAFGQSATEGVQVMGALTSSQTGLTWTKDDASTKTLRLSKTYDPDPLALTTDASACAGIVTVAVSGRPLVPVDLDGTASLRDVKIAPVQNGGSNAGGRCTLSFRSQYAGEPAATVAIDVAAGLAMQTWPAQVKYAVQGQRFTVSGAAGTCSAQALGSDGGTPDTSPPDWAAALGAATDQSGCYGGGIYMRETSGVAKTWQGLNPSCDFNVLQAGTFSPNPGAASVMVPVPQTTAGTCAIDVDDGSGGTKAYYSGLVTATVVSAANQRWVADYNVTYQDPCDRQLGDCRQSGPDTGTIGCSNPVAQPGGYEIGTIAIADVSSRGATYLYNDGSYTPQSLLPAGKSYSATSSDIHNDWSVTVEIWSCYDANDPVQPIEIR